MLEIGHSTNNKNVIIMETCIVKKGNDFEAMLYNANQRPLNLVLAVPDGKTWNNDYLLINTDVKVSWQDYYNYQGYKVLQVWHRGVLLFEKDKVSNFQIVIDTLNKFNTISKSELKVLLQESQEKEKTALEITIEEFKAEKANLKEQIKIYKEIQTKKDEIKELLSKLDS
jgi:hypothetical protein